MKKLLVTTLSLISLMSFAGDQKFEQKFKKVNPGKSFSQKHFKKYKRYKKVMYKWLELGEKAGGNASEKFYKTVHENLNFFQKYYKSDCITM